MLFQFSAAAFFYRFAIQIPFCLSQVILFSYHAMFPCHYSQFLVASNIFCSVYYVLLILTFQEARGVTIQLWRVRRADWGLPDLEQCTSNSREWILSLFSSFSQEQNAVIMMTLWCILARLQWSYSQQTCSSDWILATIPNLWCLR